MVGPIAILSPVLSPGLTPSAFGSVTEELPVPLEESAVTTYLVPDASLTGRFRRTLEGRGGSGGPGGVDGSGSGGRRGKPNLPPFFLTRVPFRPHEPLTREAFLFDQALLTAAHRRLGAVLTDAVLVMGNPLVTSRNFRTFLDDLAKVRDPDKRFADLIPHASGTVTDITFGRWVEGGFPLARLTQAVGNGRHSLRQYRLYQREGGPLSITLKDEGGGVRIYVTNQKLREDLWRLQRRMEEVTRRELISLVGALYIGSFVPDKLGDFMAFFQGFVLLLEARHSRRYPPGFFDALWQLIYHVRLASPLSREIKPVLVEDSYRRVMGYLGGASAPS